MIADEGNAGLAFPSSYLPHLLAVGFRLRGKERLEEGWIHEGLIHQLIC